MGDVTDGNSLSITVFCGAKLGNNAEYENQVHHLADIFSENQWNLVYGGSALGLMGVLARRLHVLGGRQIHGILLAPFLKDEPDGQLPSFGEHELANDYHSRKRRMAELSDAFVVLPGGLGALDELITMLQWSRLGIINHPIVLVNSVGYYDGLIKWINDANSAGFVTDALLASVKVIEDVEQLKPALGELKPRVKNTPIDDKILFPKAELRGPHEKS